MELKSQLFSLVLFCDYQERKGGEDRLRCGCKGNEEFEDINKSDSRAFGFLGFGVQEARNSPEAGWGGRTTLTLMPTDLVW